MVLRSLLVATCALTLLAGCRAGEAPVRSAPDALADAATPHPATVEPRALRLLHAWDALRADAYARGDVAALRRLYVARSALGRRDAAVLRSYVERGLVVDDLRMQVLSADVRRDGPRLVEVVVTESVSGTVRAGTSTWRLPQDRTDAHVVVLGRRHGAWRMVSAGRP